MLSERNRIPIEILLPRAFVQTELQRIPPPITPLLIWAQPAADPDLLPA